MNTGTYCIYALLMGGIGAVISSYIFQARGRDITLGFVLGLLCGLIGGLLLLIPLWLIVFLTPNQSYRCPYCRSAIPHDAVVCRYCQHPLNTSWYSPTDEKYKRPGEF